VSQGAGGSRHGQHAFNLLRSLKAEATEVGGLQYSTVQFYTVQKAWVTS